MTTKDFIPNPYDNAVDKGKSTWESPSNIALVKYWGKTGEQLPQNPSISFTLNQCKTITTVEFTKKENETSFSFEVYFEKSRNLSFEPKINTFFERVEAYLPFLKQYHFKITTSNTFPHSSGIASSASGMSALALCLMDIEKRLSGNIAESHFIKKASFLARLGSGSASRSVEGPLVVWGKHKGIKDSTDLFGVSFDYEVHDNFKNYQDTILLVDKGEKQVSSTVGHDLMYNHPFAEKRFEQAVENLTKLKKVLTTGNLDEFISIVESEALTLHAMMMTSMPYFILMKSNTLNIINSIWKFREQKGSKVCFTLDAGANVHVLFPANEKAAVGKFIRDELSKYCQNGQFIEDFAGSGAVRV
ncbi:MAG: diphosphomevalonate decarboxylase [Bacteroidota bacterium]